MAEVIWHKVVLPAHMDGSIVFARWCQCAPSSNAWFLGPTGVHIPYGILIGSAVFAQLIADCRGSLHMGDLDPNLIHASLAPPDSTSQMASRWLIHFCRANNCDRQTNRQISYSVCNSRSHLRSTAMWPNTTLCSEKTWCYKSYKRNKGMLHPLVSFITSTPINWFAQKCKHS